MYLEQEKKLQIISEESAQNALWTKNQADFWYSYSTKTLSDLQDPLVWHFSVKISDISAHCSRRKTFQSGKIAIKYCKQSCQVSRFTRESPGFRADLQVSRLVLKISRILTKIQLAKILSVLSKENPYVFVKWEIKKQKSEKVRSLLFK
jgi:hypothetical protein